MGCDEGDAPRPCQTAHCLFCAVDAVGRVCTLEDLIDEREHGVSFLCMFDHLFDAENFGVEGRDAARKVVVHLYGGEDAHR